METRKCDCCGVVVVVKWGDWLCCESDFEKIKNKSQTHTHQTHEQTQGPHQQQQNTHKHTHLLKRVKNQ
jgi:uncharacterized Zn finger protein (UPF0148 family)